MSKSKLQNDIDKATKQKLEVTQSIPFSGDELKQLEILKDPVRWSESELKDPSEPSKPLRLRPYQKIILKYKGLKRVLRMGRRTGKTVTLCVDSLYYAFINASHELLIVCPYKSQVAVIWEMFMKLVSDSDVMKASMPSKGGFRTHPYEVRFNNGSIIKGFTAGAKSGSSAGSVRGQSAHRIYLDEADYMGESSIVTINAIMASAKNTTLWASSTPTGKHESFYNYCTDKKLGFKEFHFPSNASPAWVSIEECKKKGWPVSRSQEYLFRNTTTEADYQHEYLAEFGEEVQGVFKHKDLEECLYYYDDRVEIATGLEWDPKLTQNSENVYILGVDWNDEGNGTQLVIVEYIRTPTSMTYMDIDADGRKVYVETQLMNKYRLFYRQTISIKDATQTTSIRRIIELIQKYKIDHIYVDKGFGTTQIEELKEIGVARPELKLDRKLKAIDLASNVEIRDPYTKQIIKKPMKPFMVNDCALHMERHECILPEAENERIKLIGQMRSFVVEKISDLGQPKYSKGNDHILFAWMFAIVGFQLEYSNLIHVEWNDTVKIVKGTNFIPGAEVVKDRWSTIQDKVIRFAPMREPMLGADRYTTDSRAKTDTIPEDQFNFNAVPWARRVGRGKTTSLPKRNNIDSKPKGRGRNSFVTGLI